MGYEQRRYEEAGCQPTFWELSLQEDMTQVRRDPMAEACYRLARMIMEPGIMIMIGLGACVLLAVILLAIIGVKLG